MDISVLEQQDCLMNFNNYGIYGDLVRNQYMSIKTDILSKDDIEDHINSVMNIFKDGIEQDRVHKMFINVTFDDGEDVDLNIFDYFVNLIFWILPLKVNDKITSELLFFEEDITKSNIKKYIDAFLDKHRTDYPNITLNQIIDDCLEYIGEIDNFSSYFLNTINNEDTIDLMNENKEFYDCIHVDLSGTPIENVKNVGMDYTNKAIDIIKNSNHCLRDSFRAKEGINPKQFKEFLVHNGSKPNGTGGVFPAIINSSFSNGGLSDVASYFMESSVGRIALMIQKENVGDSGHFSRILGLNNQQSRIHPDPHYKCNTKNLLKINIANAEILDRYKHRYYRTHPNGIDKKLSSDPVRDNPELIGKTVWFRSPVTCASGAQGKGICYACYGSLAYVNNDINIGKIASELLCAVLTQMLLSAKHLLESSVEALIWTEGFKDLFDVAFNIIGLRDDVETKKMNLILEDVHSDDSDMGEDYVTYFKVQFPDNSVKVFRTENEDNIYLSKELQSIISKDPSAESYIIPFDSIRDNCIFLVHINNNELSKTLENIKTTINRANEVHGNNTKEDFVMNFLQSIIEGGISLDAVHAEIIVSNQIRNSEDVLDKPDWTIPNETYQMLTLNEALTNNPSITVSLEYQKQPKALYYPMSFKKIKASTLDLFFMEQPQNLMSIETPVSDIKSDRDVIEKAFSQLDAKTVDEVLAIPQKAFSKI